MIINYERTKYKLSKFFTQQALEPTPRPNRISNDYKQEYPSIEVEGRTVINKKKKKKEDSPPNNMENVKLDTEVSGWSLVILSLFISFL